MAGPEVCGRKRKRRGGLLGPGVREETKGAGSASSGGTSLRGQSSYVQTWCALIYPGGEKKRNFFKICKQKHNIYM